MSKLITKQEKIQFIINKLEWLKGLEFIDKDEISACTLVKRILNDCLKTQ